MRIIKYPVTIHSKISGDTMENLNKVANTMKKTTSELIREILEDYLK